MKKLLFLFIGLWSFYYPAYSQTSSLGVELSGTVLIRYGKIHVGNGEVIDNGYIEINGHEISRVADVTTTRINEADYDTIINADGKEIYPGFIIMDSRLGLTEIGAVKASNDYDETGDFLPNVNALPAFNSESKIISTVRTNGVLMAQIAPTGGIISGGSSVVHFDGWNWQEATVRADEGVFLNWPKRYTQSGWWADPGKAKTNKKYKDQLGEINAFFDEAKAYQKLAVKTHQNLRFEAMSGLFSGTQRLYIRVDEAKCILDAIQFIRSYGIESTAIVGGEEAVAVTNELKENKIPVVIDRVHKLPNHNDSPVDEPFKRAGQLADVGIDISFATSGSMEAMISRNLPFQVGTAVYYGLDYERAIQSLTLDAAKLLGIDESYGSLEPGKNATLFISEGDALDIPTNNITCGIINGHIIDLNNHQKALNEKFARKHGVSP
ncbi:MAG: amidohydrolase family protein [Salibacteraceae bacterium]